MRDFLPDDVAPRASIVIGVIADVFESYGFEPLETPAVENIETLTGQVRRRRRSAHLQDPEARRRRRARARRTWRCATTSPCRWRAWSPSTGPGCRSSSSATRCSRCGAPTARRRAASASSTSATSTPSARRRWWSRPNCCRPAPTCCARLGFADFTIRLNHRRLLTAMLERGGVPTDLHGTALVALDKLDKIGREAVVAEMTDARRPEAAAATLRRVPLRASPARTTARRSRPIAGFVGITRRAAWRRSPTCGRS